MSTPIRVLILEDRVADAELMLHELRRAGFDSNWQRVETEPDYLAGLETNPDLILANWSLPQFSGLRALQLMNERGLDIPFVIVTGNIGEEAAVEAMRLGAADYLLKDRLARLGQAVFHALENKRLQEERKRAEEQLRYQAILLANVDDAIVASDSQYWLTVWNAAAEALYGWKAEEVLGRNGLEITRTEWPGVEAEEMRRRIDKAGRWRGEATQAHRDGTRFPVEVSSIVLRDEGGQITGYVSVNHDITERKRTEQALKDSEKRFRDIADNAQEWIWEVDVNGKYTYASQMVEKVMGYTPQEILQKYYYDLFHPEDREALKASALTAFAAKQPFREFINRNVHKNGQTIWLSTSALPLLDDQGNMLGYRGADTDITERKRAESILQARVRLTIFSASNLLEKLMQNTLDEICTLTDSPIGFFHYVEADERTISKQAWSTRTLAEMCTAEGRGRHYDIDEAGVWVDCVRQRRPVIHNDYASLPHRKGMPAGHAPVIREMVFPITRNQKIVAIIGVGNKPQDYTEDDVDYALQLADLAWDIVENKRAEEALQESEAKYRTLVENIPQKIFMKDRESRFLSVNENFSRDLGIRPADIVGKTDYDFYPKDLADKYRADDFRIMKTAQTEELEEKYMQEGREIWVHTIKTPVRDENGEIVALLGVFWDITERKQVEETLQASEQRFRALIENSAEAILLVDGDGTLLYLSPSYSQLLGYSDEERKGQNGFSLVHPEDRIHLLALLRENLQKPSRVVIPATRVRHKDGSWRWIEGIANNLLSEPNVQAIVVNFHDITERKRAEMQLNEQLEELRRWHRATLGRETRLLDLKREVNELLVQAGQPLRYPSVETENQ